MADWKMPVNYNYNPSYHAYAYGLVYQAGPEQTHSNLSGWAEAAYQTGVNGGYYSTPQQAPQLQESPPRSPDRNVLSSDQGQHFPGLYFGDSHTQNGRLFLSHNQTQLDGLTREVERPNSDISDSEAHTSPDSWSSGSSRERCIPPTHPATWAIQDDHTEENCNRSPDGNERVSSSIPEEPPTSHVIGAEEESIPDTKTTSKTKPKPRAAFSQSQMITLTHRFNIQRYLTPVEMKTLAGLTGLTYKQVKTWFQNRRMKLRRHQKDNSWVSERYTGAVYTNVPPHNTQIQTQDYYNQQMRETGLNRRSPTQNLPYYTGPSAFPPKSSSPQPAPRPQASNWPLPPPVTHYERITNCYSMGGSVNNTSTNSDEGNPPPLHSPICMAIGRNAAL